MGPRRLMTDFCDQEVREAVNHEARIRNLRADFVLGTPSGSESTLWALRAFVSDTEDVEPPSILVSQNCLY